MNEWREDVSNYIIFTQPLTRWLCLCVVFHHVWPQATSKSTAINFPISWAILSEAIYATWPRGTSQRIVLLGGVTAFLSCLWNVWEDHHLEWDLPCTAILLMEQINRKRDVIGRFKIAVSYFHSIWLDSDGGRWSQVRRDQLGKLIRNLPMKCFKCSRSQNDPVLQVMSLLEQQSPAIVIGEFPFDHSIANLVARWKCLLIN